MAELLVRVIDKVNEDPEKDVGCLKRGDVVVVCPDGWGWSEKERKNSDWRILRVPYTVGECQDLLTPQDDGKSEFDPTKSKTLLRRAAKIDLDDNKVPNEIKVSLEDDKRINAIIDVKTFDIKKVKKIK